MSPAQCLGNVPRCLKDLSPPTTAHLQVQVDVHGDGRLGQGVAVHEGQEAVQPPGAQALAEVLAAHLQHLAHRLMSIAWGEALMSRQDQETTTC